MRRMRLVLPALLVACWLASPASAASTCASPAAPTRGDGFVIVDEPDHVSADPAPPLAQLQPDVVQHEALALPELARAMRMRPGSTVRVRYLADLHRWRVSVRDRVASRTLASVEIADRKLCGGGPIIGRPFALPLGEYPSRSSEREVIDAAVADPGVRRLAKRWGGVDELHASGSLDGCCWEVDLFAPQRTDGDPNTAVIRVDVTDATRQVTGRWTGLQIAWKMARGERRAFGGDINAPFLWLPLLALFALVAIDWTRPRAWQNADVLAILAIGVSHELFLEGHVYGSVPLTVPPLLWLAARMGWIFLRGMPAPRAQVVPRRRHTRLALRPVPTMLLVVLAVALAGLRIGVTLDGGNVIDVGYAGVAGARLEHRGSSPYGHMPSDIPHGDTYGPVNYLAYVPAIATIDDPDHDVWGDSLPAAQYTSIGADLLCALLLGVIGWRWISRRGAVLLALAWLACPWTTWALASGVNDALVAVPLLAAFALLPRSLLRGSLVGLAAMVKFAPIVALAPMLHAGSRDRTRQAALAILGAALTIGAALAWVAWRLDGSVAHDLHVFWERTVGFQDGRGSPFSPWGLYGWHTAQRIAQVVVLLLIAATCLVPRARDAWQVAAGAGAAIILLELTVTHWFYLYVPWFVGFVLIVLVAARERPAPAAPVRSER
jgi:hypothetical protein